MLYRFMSVFIHQIRCNRKGASHMNCRCLRCLLLDNN